MNKVPKSFVMVLRRRYRVYFNPQGGSWYVAYNDGAERQRRTLGVATKPEAEAAVRLLDAPAEQQQPQVVEKSTWEQLQSEFLAYKTGLQKAPKTVKRYGVALKAFGRYLRSRSIHFLEQINLSVLDGYKAFRMKNEKCDVRTWFNDSIVVKSAFKWGCKASRGFLRSNPSLDWETPEPVKPKRTIYTWDEVAAMEKGVRDWLRPIVTVLAWSGMRIDELINLRWNDLDFERRVIHIRIREDWRPKGRHDRLVPMHPKVQAALSGLSKSGENVFLAVRSGKRLTEQSVLESLKADQGKLGLTVADLHAFRRFFTTMMMRAGVDIETVRQWGGWKSLKTMLRYLAEINSVESVKAMDSAVGKLDSFSEKNDKGMTKNTVAPPRVA